MTRPRALLIDLDDTIYAYAPRHQAALDALARAAVELGAVDDAATFGDAYQQARRATHERLAGTAASHHRLLYVQGALERLTGEARPTLALALYDAYWDGYLADLKPDPDAREALLAFREAGLRLAFVTDLTAHDQLRKLRRLGLEELGVQLVTSEEAGREKPDRAPFDLALAKLGLTASREVWMIGDSLTSDVAGARQLGLFTVWLRRSATQDVVGPPPDAVVGDWAALRRLVLEGR